MLARSGTTGSPAKEEYSRYSILSGVCCAWWEGRGGGGIVFNGDILHIWHSNLEVQENLQYVRFCHTPLYMVCFEFLLQNSLLTTYEVVVQHDKELMKRFSKYVCTYYPRIFHTD